MRSPGRRRVVLGCVSVAVLVSVLRVLFGVAVGGPLGILTGFVLGWNRTADDYLHPIYVLLRSIPSLALITAVFSALRYSLVIAWMTTVGEVF